MRNVLDGIVYDVVHGVVDISGKIEKKKKGIMSVTTVYKSEASSQLLTQFYKVGRLVKDLPPLSHYTRTGSIRLSYLHLHFVPFALDFFCAETLNSASLLQLGKSVHLLSKNKGKMVIPSGFTPKCKEKLGPIFNSRAHSKF